jgi:hypothetical protein
MTAQAGAHAGPKQSSVAHEVLRDQYGEICKSHAGITDFRAKLLSLLPIASGAGLILVGKNMDRPLLTPIGLYGVAVTLGLFWYELRGIQTCKGLREQATQLEDFAIARQQRSAAGSGLRAALGPFTRPSSSDGSTSPGWAPPGGLSCRPGSSPSAT